MPQTQIRALMAGVLAQRGRQVLQAWVTRGGRPCFVSGIAPQTAQTMVQLGIDLSEVTTRASPADALALAIARVAAHADRSIKP